MVSLLWEKCDGCWVESGIVSLPSVFNDESLKIWEKKQWVIFWLKVTFRGSLWILMELFQAIDFSVADKTPEYAWEPARDLSNHLAHCSYRDLVEYPEGRVPVLAANLQQITKEFMLKLPYFIWICTYSTDCFWVTCRVVLQAWNLMSFLLLREHE